MRRDEEHESVLTQLGTPQPGPTRRIRDDARIEIANCANVDTSFPGFVELACAAGLGVERDDG